MHSGARTAFDTIFEIAEDQHGYFTTKQAVAAGVDPRAVIMMAGRGAIVRLHRGVYRISRFPESPYGQYMEATMWPQGADGVISHDSALLLFEMSDVNPDTVHITVPRLFRIRRAIPRFLTVHHGDLEPDEIARVETIRVTTPVRAIEDSIRSNMSRALLMQAVSDGVRHGRLTRKEGRRMNRRIAGVLGSRSSKMKVLPPRSAGQLAKRVRAFAKDGQVAEGRVRLWIANMALLGLIEANRDGSPAHTFVVKGGVAIELRLRDRARATRDLDLTVHSLSNNLVEIVETVLEGEFDGFTFRRTGTAHVMPNATVRLRIAVQYRSQSWTTVRVDASHSKPSGVDVEYAEPISLAQFGLKDPPPVPCLSLPYQLAQKIHAFTQPGASAQEPVRTRDLVDVLLLRELVSDFPTLREVCVEVFSDRATHGWPPEPSDSTGIDQAEFARISSPVGLSGVDLRGALQQFRDFVGQIDSSGS